MPVCKHLRSLIQLLVLLVIFPAGSQGQVYRFRNYGSESKLPDTYINAIGQDQNGFLWVGTQEGAVKFDGFDFHRVTFPDSSSGRSISVIYRDRLGKVWLGCSDGAIFYNTNDGLVKIHDQGIQNVNDMLGDKDGNIWVIPQDKMILRINPEKPGDVTRILNSRALSMTAGCFGPDGGLLIGTSGGLFWCSVTGDSVSVKSPVKGIDEYTKVNTVKKVSNIDLWLVGTDGSGLFTLSFPEGKPVVKRIPGHPELESADIKAITEDNAGNTWIAVSGSGVTRISFSDKSGSPASVKTFTASSGLVGVDVRTIFQDMEGDIWLGFFGEGLAMLASDAYSYFAPSSNPDENSIIFITSKDKKFLLGTSRGYYLFNLNTGRSESFVNLSREVTGEISCFYSGNGNSLFIGTKNNGVWVKDGSSPARQFYRSGNTGEDYVRDINFSDGRLWLATLNGVVILDSKTAGVIRKFRIEDRLPHNSINQVFRRSNGNYLPATECDRLFDINLDKGIIIGSQQMKGGSRNKVTSYAEDSLGTIYAATAGNGLYCIRKDTVFNISKTDGLFNNYCYSAMLDSKGTLWIGHERGFSMFDLKTGVVKGIQTDFAKKADSEKGIDCNPNTIYESDGKVLIGTTDGIIIYERARDIRVHMPPINNIIGVTINNKPYPIRSSYSLKYKKYTVRIDYVGINFNAPDKVLYKTRIDNLNEDWTDFRPARSIEYPISDGKYRFNMISVGEDGLSGKAPLTFDIFVKKPVWRTWWFTLLIIAVIAGIVILIVRERDKAQAKIKEYLETELEARTRLVMKQKDEIEMQNIEITDSINYAKRIQSSILPDIARLKETFSDAFILFHPRDIVSGDFYWFDKISKDKFIIVCADSTGHGVPGAFMSMIGSTLLQDIISRKGITRPSEVLKLLDKQIFSTLNQNIDVGVSNDGMDMVVCEINVQSKLIRFASAMRPVIIVMGGESYYIKGNRCSVGGESVIEKFFDDQEYYLSAGDSIYMFSDGLPDQFGGADGKKLKIARMKRLIEDASPKPMIEQKQIFSDFFFEWKGDYEQVDDILLMGIRL
ncbi:MAG TPA: two-component regulator propeller domain-containing protein [Bacteroidales bacterium]|nr:two-component regulator propeller domain-containing protein [Bacteroidales bacterium]